MIYELVDRLVYVRTEEASIPWGLGQIGPWNEVSQTSNPCLRLDFAVSKRLPPAAPQTSAQAMHYWSTDKNGVVRYRRSSGLGRELAMDIDLSEDHQSLQVSSNRLMLNLVRFRFNNLHSPGYAMTDVACQILAQQAWAPIHCSAVADPSDGKLALIVAPPNTGKTLTAMKLVQEHDFMYVAEDMGFFKQGEFRGVTWTNTFRYYPSLNQTQWQRWRMAAKDVLPPLELIKHRYDTSLLDLVQPHQVVRGGEVKRIFILAGSGDGSSLQTKELTPEDAYSVIRNLNRYEFKYETAPVVVAMEGLTGHLDIELGARTVETQIRSLTREVPVTLIQETEPANFASRIMMTMSGE